MVRPLRQAHVRPVQDEEPGPTPALRNLGTWDRTVPASSAHSLNVKVPRTSRSIAFSSTTMRRDSTGGMGSRGHTSVPSAPRASPPTKGRPQGRPGHHSQVAQFHLHGHPSPPLGSNGPVADNLLRFEGADGRESSLGIHALGYCEPIYARQKRSTHALKPCTATSA